MFFKLIFIFPSARLTESKQILKLTISLYNKQTNELVLLGAIFNKGILYASNLFTGAN